VDTDRLQEEYTRLVNGLAREGLSQDIADELSANPVLPSDIVDMVLPGSIRKADHFLGLLRRFVEFVKQSVQKQVVVHLSPLKFLLECFREVKVSSHDLKYVRCIMMCVSWLLFSGCERCVSTCGKECVT
jgi:DNA excision repair protein ERCC-2